MTTLTMKMTQVWRIRGNTDHTEGRGATYYVHIPRDENPGPVAGEHGMMGYPDGDPVLVDAIEFSDGTVRVLSDVVMPSGQVLRNKALAKLTPEERKALGL